MIDITYLTPTEWVSFRVSFKVFGVGLTQIIGDFHSPWMQNKLMNRRTIYWGELTWKWNRCLQSNKTSHELYILLRQIYIADKNYFNLIGVCFNWIELLCLTLAEDLNQSFQFLVYFFVDVMFVVMICVDLEKKLKYFWKVN